VYTVAIISVWWAGDALSHDPDVAPQKVTHNNTPGFKTVVACKNKNKKQMQKNKCENKTKQNTSAVRVCEPTPQIIVPTEKKGE
jgi:hypothetical protein